MKGNYQKFVINMERQTDAYRLWKHGSDEVVCVLETYREKRSVFFSVQNLLPSNYLHKDKSGAYHVVLLGAENGQLLHEDFGVFHVSQNGEGTFFQKFTGPALSSYTHCLLVVDWRSDAEPEVIYQGETPFFCKAERSDSWEELRKWCESQTPTKAFSAKIDETKASWYRVPAEEPLPEVLEMAKSYINRYRHYLFGCNGERYYVGIPGRFLQKEQPCREKALFFLWQPLRGGEKFFDETATMTARQQEEIFGYWIAEVNLETGGLKPL